MPGLEEEVLEIIVLVSIGVFFVCVAQIGKDIWLRSAALRDFQMVFDEVLLAELVQIYFGEFCECFLQNMTK